MLGLGSSKSELSFYVTITEELDYLVKLTDVRCNLTVKAYYISAFDNYFTVLNTIKDTHPYSSVL